jgi:hypothetical protein
MGADGGEPASCSRHRSVAELAAPVLTPAG